MTRLRGRGRRGQRVRDHAPHGHWNTTTMIGSIRLDGTTCCLAVEGATTRDIYREFVRQVLCPLLRPGDIVIADNLSVHKDDECTDLIEARGASYGFLPPYSPDLNPIENLWSKVKQSLRSSKARTQDDLYAAIGKAMSAITPADATGYFSSCGYATSQS